MTIVRYFKPAGVERHDLDALPKLLKRDAVICARERPRHAGDPGRGRQSYVGLLDPADSDDLVRQFERVRGTVDGEREFLDGVVDFFQTRTTTRIHFAMERLALLTAILLPITAIASIYGMNIIVNAETQATQVVIVIVLMLLVTAGMLAWTKRLGWW